MNHKRKLNLKKQLACIYTADLFSGLRITDAVWVALLAARGFSLWEIGLAESVFHVVSLLCEVPSGMAADLLGRKKTLLSGGVCMVLQSLLMAFASDLFTICFAMGLNALAMTMFSGTSDLHAGQRRGLHGQHPEPVSRLRGLLSAERRL